MNELILNPVFIDTSVFYNNKFDFTSKQFNQLTELSRNHLIKIVITEINQKEITKHIKELSFNADNSFKSYLKKNSLVRNNIADDFKKIEKYFQQESIFNASYSSFEKWLSDASVEILPIYHSNPKEIFDLYFNRQPPFKNKKHEFPDAFCLSIICNKYKDINIISIDGDMLEFKHPSISNHFNSLNSFIDYILKSNYSVHSLIIKEYNKHKTYIINQIKEGFLSFNFLSFRGLYTDVPKINNFIIVEEKIIDIHDGVATIILTICIYYEILICYKEDDGYETEEDIHSMDVEVIFRFVENPFENEFQDIKIESIKPKTPEDTLVMINEEEFGM